MLATLVWAGVNLVVTVSVSGPPPSPYAAGEFTGRLLVASLFASLVTWRIVGRVHHYYNLRFWQLVVLALPLFLLLRFLTLR